VKKQQINQIKQVLEAFNKKNVGYCVLRNYEFLLGSYDPVESLDTLIAKQDMPLAHQILLQNGFNLRKQQFSLAHKAYFKILPDFSRISFDIQVGGIYWNDMKYLSEQVLQSRKKKSYFYVPNDNHTFVMLLVHSILGKRYFKKKYQQILVNIPIDEKAVYKEVRRIFNQKIAKKILPLARFGKTKKINPYTLIIYFLLKKPRRLITLSALTLRWIKWKKPMQPSPLISVIGPDGAGKSTVVNELKNHLEKTNRKVSHIYTGRGRNHFLPITKLGFLYKQREKTKDNINKKKNGKPKKEKSLTDERNNRKRKIIYTLVSPIFALDLLCRYYFRIFPERMKKKIVITDRYCSDIILMQYVPLSIKKILLALFPKPTMTFFLYNTPEILHQRRPEEPIEELSRQMVLFQELNSLNPIKIITENKHENTTTIISTILKNLNTNWN